MVTKQILLELNEEDTALLERLQQTTGQPKAKLLRWALRHYVSAGPWTDVAERRLFVVGNAELPLETYLVMGF